VSAGWKTHKCPCDEEAIEEILHIKANFQQKQVCQKQKKVKNIYVQEITVKKSYMQIENTYVQVKHLCQSDEETFAFVKVIRRLCFIEYRSAKQDIILQVSFHESVLQISNNWSIFCQSDDRLCHMHHWVVIVKISSCRSLSENEPCNDWYIFGKRRILQNKASHHHVK